MVMSDLPEAASTLLCSKATSKATSSEGRGLLLVASEESTKIKIGLVGGSSWEPYLTGKDIHEGPDLQIR
jgi:hypothetical protein